jgi:hypothetical protein
VVVPDYNLATYIAIRWIDIPFRKDKDILLMLAMDRLGFAIIQRILCCSATKPVRFLKPHRFCSIAQIIFIPEIKKI